MQKRISILLLILCAFFSGIGRTVYAQGWSFTVTVKYSGPCGANAPQLPLFTIPFMSTRNECETIRSQIAVISSSVPIYDSNGNYLGECTAYASCTSCTGSDMTSGTSSDPGSVSINGLAQGSPFFSPHESESVESWIGDIVQRLKSMGYAVDEKNITSRDLPLTGDENFDKYYTEQSIRFEKPEKGGTVYLDEGQNSVDPNALKNPGKTDSGKGKSAADAPGTVQMPSSNEEWYHLEPLENGGIPPVPESNNDPNARYEHPKIELVREAAVTAAGWLPDGAAYPGIVAVNVWAEDAKAIQDIRDGNNPQDFNTSMKNAWENSVTDIKNQAVEDVKGMGTEKGLEIISGSKGFAKLASGADDLNSKWQDLGGKTAGGEGDGIFGKITKAAGWLGQAPDSGN